MRGRSPPLPRSGSNNQEGYEVCISCGITHSLRPCSTRRILVHSLSPVFLSYVFLLIIDLCYEQSGMILGSKTRSEDLRLVLPEVQLVKQLEVLCSQGMMRAFL